jgi:transposase-like protein
MVPSETRNVERPSHGQLREDARTMSMLAVGRRYGVSDNAVRKWIRWYERGFEGKGETEAA